MKTSRHLSLTAWMLLIGLLPWATIAHARTWNDITGKYKVEAELIEFKDGTVQLRTSAGKVISLPLKKLSQDDQDFLLKPEAPSAKPTSPAPPTTSRSSVPPKTGRFTTSFDEHSPLAKVSVVYPRTLPPAELAKIQTKLNQAGEVAADYYYKPEEETWDVYVPEDYRGDAPYGLFVFINSGDSAGGGGGYVSVFKKYRLIFVGANKSGNGQDTLLRRIPMAVDAVHNMRKRYHIDDDRIYISGNSGGGRAASWTSIAFADVFTGGQFHIGCNHYRSIPLGDGKFLPGKIHIHSQKLMQHAAQNNRYVFVTGDKDFNREQTQKTATAWQKDGFRHITYLQVPGMAHSAPPLDWFEKGIVALDAPLRAAAKSAFTEARKLEGRGKLGDALLAYRRAAAHGHDQDFAAEAQEGYAKIRVQYDAAVAEVEAAIASGAPTVVKQISEFRKTWAKAGTADAKRLAEAAREARKKS